LKGITHLKALCQVIILSCSRDLKIKSTAEDSAANPPEPDKGFCFFIKKAVKRKSDYTIISKYEFLTELHSTDSE
jgi:hypothetical protein